MPIDIPDRETCYRMMVRMDMLEHIAVHSIVVAAVALVLTDELGCLGLKLNRKLICASALLHDITKTRSILTGEPHAETGEAYLVKEGLTEVGRIVGQHVALDRYDVGGAVTEAEIVNYADKRVLHDRIVSLKKRMAYILERYGTKPERRERLTVIGEKTVMLEKKLFRPLSFSPSDVDAMVAKASLAEELETYRRGLGLVAN